MNAEQAVRERREHKIQLLVDERTMVRRYLAVIEAELASANVEVTDAPTGTTWKVRGDGVSPASVPAIEKAA